MVLRRLIMTQSLYVSFLRCPQPALVARRHTNFATYCRATNLHGAHTRDLIRANLIARVALVEFGFLLSASSKLQLLSDAEIHLALCCILLAKYVIEGIGIDLRGC
jgi:hypothetical protein